MTTALTSPSAAEEIKVDLAHQITHLFPDPHNCTEAEYLAADTNLLIEFSDGNIQVLPMPTDHHQAIVAFLFEALLMFVRPAKLGVVRFAALKVKLREGKYREPDVLFIKAQNDDRRQNAFWLWADLVMEVVSEENRAHDLNTKRIEYARAGIPEYWIVDPKLSGITILKLVATTYEPVGVYHAGDLAGSVVLPGFVVDVTSVFHAK